MPQDQLQLWLVQADTVWQDRQANLGNLEELISMETGEVDLILLPEMFSTGFTMEAKAHSEPMNLYVTKWMTQMASRTGAVVAGSFICQDAGQYFNRLVWASPGGEMAQYDKRHLFRMAKEDEHYAPGKEKLIVELKGWKVCPLICYDLRFPVWSRNQDLAYDLLLYVANWPAKRISSWDTLLKARAMENLAYVAGVNRVGTDGYEVEYNGHSGVYGPKGKTHAFSEGEETVLKARLDYGELQRFREKFPAHLDADRFTL